ncbi:hypothetical protein BGI41_04925 [Methanobrevibacter sp. 87.7]|uniref:restriction endonuclease subunit S n=1 Tax=Methanobrevibacter sp. 87.7 TaxID=387957 RepID=UPI000B509A2B|nr:restriction endonuclease subunit S [Methanobrevibacter sp. 87.7]OWT32954.1 hypothetical protein BGI41_04925 [Methanobrevibacter sp. 87.7]
MVIKKLMDVADVYSGVHISRFVDSESDLKPVIRNKYGLNDTLEYEYKRISNSLNSKYYSKKDDILISLSEPNSVTKLYEEGYIITMNFAVIRLKEGYDPSFFYHLLKSNYFLKKLHKLREGGALRIIKVADLRKIKFDIPDLDTQKKYGEFLNLIDRKIKLEKKSIKYKKDYEEAIIENLYK